MSINQKRGRQAFRRGFVLGSLTWDQAVVSFRFVNNIPAGMAKRKESPILAVAVRENVWEPLKLGLISGYRLSFRFALPAGMLFSKRNDLRLGLFEIEIKLR